MEIMRLPYEVDEEMSRKVWSKIKPEEHGFIQDKETMWQRYLDADGPIPSGTLYDIFKMSALNYRSREALVDDFYGLEKEKRRRKTWQQLYDDVNTIILNLLDLGIEPGDIVGDILGNTMETLMLHYACAKLGAIYSFLHIDMPPQWTKDGLERFIVDPKIYCVAPSLLRPGTLEVLLDFKKEAPSLKHIFALTKPDEAVPEGTESFSRLLDRKIWEKYSEQDIEKLKPDPLDVLTLWNTSATTGFPKLPTCNILFPYATMTRWADRTLTSCYDKYLLFGPITGPTPRGFALTAHLKGADFIMLAKFSEEAMCRITEEERVTMWVGHPVMMVATFNSPYFSKYDMSSLRAWAWAGALIPTSIRYKLWDMGIKTFASGGAISAACENMQGGGEQLYKKKIMCESYGQAKRGMEMKIVDPKDKKTLVKPGEVGEIAYRGPTFGAWRNPEYNKETFDEEGWEWDGDYATWDEEENITWVGRPENVTIKGGKIIGPIDIESALLYNPKIAQAVAAPVPAKEKEVGHRVCLYVVPKAGETITLEEVREYLRAGGIDDFALPERLEILDKMPLSAGGKVDYVTLGKLTEEKLKAEGKI